MGGFAYRLRADNPRAIHAQVRRRAEQLRKRPAGAMAGGPAGGVQRVDGGWCVSKCETVVRMGIAGPFRTYCTVFYCNCKR